MSSPKPSSWKRLSRDPLFVPVAIAVAFAAVVVALVTVGYLRDPDRMARKRFDAAIAAAGDPETALRRLDQLLASPDVDRVGRDRAERAGAAVVRLSAGLAPAPFTRAQLDQVARVIARYRALPGRARGGVALDALVAALVGWADALAAPADADARLTVLRQALAVARAEGAESATPRMIELRLEVAAARSVDWPLDALAILIDEPRTPALLARATEIVARLVERPSLLDDAGPDLDAWLAATAAADPLRQRVEAQRALAVTGRAQAQAEDVTAEQLAAMMVERPWDQAVAVRLATDELHAGHAEAAEARLRGFGPPGLLTREARVALVGRGGDGELLRALVVLALTQEPAALDLEQRGPHEGIVLVRLAEPALALGVVDDDEPEQRGEVLAMR